MFEKEAEEYANKEYEMSSFVDHYGIADAFQEGAEFGYNKAMKEWRGCFMSCSSPYCGDKFRDIRCNGMLGNMTKTVKENNSDKLTDDVMNDWKEMED